jgi:hypothetical protein
MLTITIDQKSAFAASAGQLDLEPICTDLGLPDSQEDTRCVVIGDHGYILSENFQPNDALLTISLEPDGPLTALSPEARPEALARLLRCAITMVNGNNRSWPPRWHVFHTQNRLAFEADNYSRKQEGGRTQAGRIVLDISRPSGYRIFAFLLDRFRVLDLNAFDPPQGLLEAALKGIAAALVARPSMADKETGNRVGLEIQHPIHPGSSWTMEEWYESHLTVAQRRVVDFQEEGCVRVYGSPGTGKTLTLVMKCLRDLGQAVAKGADTRALFLTHSLTTAEDIKNLVLNLEKERGLDWMTEDPPRLVVTTLYTLANDQQRYDLDGLTAVSLDGHEGQERQAVILNDVIESYRRRDWIARRSACSQPFVAYMESQPGSLERRFFLWALLNEFACVLDADGIRSSKDARARYLKEARKGWMMTLSETAEREVVLSLYDAFRQFLRDERMIGGDQMISDYLTHLDSFRWEATRSRQGFDMVFVDELHLFNRQERMTLRHLLRSTESIPKVYMAYDPKQSPRDTFLNLPSENAERLDIWRSVNVGRIEGVELQEVFRFTPQISRALASIDDSFPGQDLDEDWPKYGGRSQLEDGQVPTVSILPTDRDVYSFTFKRARDLQRDLGKTRRRVAVLCVSQDLFSQFLANHEFQDSFIPITSREFSPGTIQGTRKFVFSMPEFVAGRQFDTVLLVGMNQNETPSGPFGMAAVRKFVSQVYLGASRAERCLEFYASKDGGEAHKVLSLPVMNGVVRNVDWRELP